MGIITGGIGYRLEELVAEPTPDEVTAAATADALAAAEALAAAAAVVGWVVECVEWKDPSPDTRDVSLPPTTAGMGAGACTCGLCNNFPDASTTVVVGVGTPAAALWNGGGMNSGIPKVGICCKARCCLSTKVHQHSITMAQSR